MFKGDYFTFHSHYNVPLIALVWKALVKFNYNWLILKKKMNNSNVLDWRKYRFLISASVKSFSFNILPYSSFPFGGHRYHALCLLRWLLLKLLLEHISFYKDLFGKLEQGMLLIYHYWLSFLILSVWVIPSLCLSPTQKIHASFSILFPNHFVV